VIGRAVFFWWFLGMGLTLTQQTIEFKIISRLEEILIGKGYILNAKEEGRKGEGY
jgi:hypothetical protein